MLVVVGCSRHVRVANVSLCLSVALEFREEFIDNNNNNNNNNSNNNSSSSSSSSSSVRASGSGAGVFVSECCAAVLSRSVRDTRCSQWRDQAPCRIHLPAIRHS